MSRSTRFFSEAYVCDMIEGRRSGRSFLKPLSWLYRAGVALRNLAFDAGVFKSLKARVPVVSIGNIVAGGSGKTPLVHLLARELSQSVKVAILSRGYRSKTERENQVVCLSSTTPVEVGGDEPCLLKRKLPDVAVWVGKNRQLSSQLAMMAGARVILLDDGMQYRKLHRDIEIAVISAADPFGHGGFLPYGYLRDDPKRLRAADLIVLNEGNDATLQTLRTLTKAPIVGVRMRLKTELQGKQVALVCAIANPARFERSVREAGAVITGLFFKSDHDSFTAQEIIDFARPGVQLICTEKDAVKLPKLPPECSVLPIEAELEVVSGHEAWGKMLEKIRGK